MQMKLSDGTVMLGGAIVRKQKRETNSGKTVCNFGLSVGNDRDNKKFASCVAWEKVAKCVDSYEVGDKLIVIGKVEQRSYTTKAGEQRTENECTVSFVLNGLQFNYFSNQQEDEYVYEAEPSVAVPANDDDFMVIDSDESLPF